MNNTRHGTRWERSKNVGVKGTPADFDNARQWFPTRSQEQWVALFDASPDVFHAILGDIFRETRAEAEREAGKARIGRRPKAIDGSMAELERMITPQYSHDPFPVAVEPLLKAAPSLRAFAQRVGINHHTLTRMIRGELPLDRFRLERIARAGKVHPGYFMEYREMMIVEAVQSFLRAKPNASVRLHKQLRSLLQDA